MDVKPLFLQEATVSQHVAAQTVEPARYAGVLLLLVEQGVELSHATRARSLAAAWARRDHELAGFMLGREDWALPEVVRALELLDTGRRSRALRKRVARLERSPNVRASRLGALRSEVNDLAREGTDGSLTGALAKHVRRWVRSIPPAKLEYYAMTFPLEPWRRLADLVHLAPGDFQLSWFLATAFGAPAPEGTATADALAADLETLPALLARHALPYSFLRTRFPALPERLRAAVAAYEPLDDLIWYYDDLRSPEVQRAVVSRLAEGEQPGLGLGKLIERLMAFQQKDPALLSALLPAAEARLARVQLPLESPVVVIGDASSSMQVAIRVATIVGSLLAAVAHADLRFFNQGPIATPVLPRSVAQALEVAHAIRADGWTAPAAALWPSLERNEVVRTFVLVTDEEENRPFKGMLFADMFAQYRTRCFPANLALVSFAPPGKPGPMARALEARGIPCLSFRLDPRKPDLTKLDAIFGLLAAEAGSFDARAATVASRIESRSLGAVVAELRDDPASAGLMFSLGSLVSTLRHLVFGRVEDKLAFISALSRVKYVAEAARRSDLRAEAQALIADVLALPPPAPLPRELLDRVVAAAESWELRFGSGASS